MKGCMAGNDCGVHSKLLAWDGVVCHGTLRARNAREELTDRCSIEAECFRCSPLPGGPSETSGLASFLLFTYISSPALLMAMDEKSTLSIVLF